MATASLNNFTVPLATNQSASQQGLLMPKLQYRFRVTLTSFGAYGDPATELTKQVMTVDRPHPSFDEIKLDVYNSTVKLAGRHKFDDIKLKIRDDINNNVTNIVGQQLQKQFDFYNQSSAFSGQDYKFFMAIEILDGANGAFTPQVLEVYGKGDPFEIELTICFDNAYQTDAAGTLLTASSPVVRGQLQSAV